MSERPARCDRCGGWCERVGGRVVCVPLTEQLDAAYAKAIHERDEAVDYVNAYGKRIQELRAENERLREIEAWAGPRLGNCRRWSVSGISQCGEAGYQCSDCRGIIAKHQGVP